MLERTACSQEPFTPLNQRKVLESEAAIASLSKMLEENIEKTDMKKCIKAKIVQRVLIHI